MMCLSSATRRQIYTGWPADVFLTATSEWTVWTESKTAQSTFKLVVLLVQKSQIQIHLQDFEMQIAKVFSNQKLILFFKY